MNSRRARRAALRFWFSAALLAALSLAPLAPAFAWSPPPRPLPTEPADPDGRDDSLHDDRPAPPSGAGQLGLSRRTQIGAEAQVAEVTERNRLIVRMIDCCWLWLRRLCTAGCTQR